MQATAGLFLEFQERELEEVFNLLNPLVRVGVKHGYKHLHQAVRDLAVSVESPCVRVELEEVLVVLRVIVQGL